MEATKIAHKKKVVSPKLRFKNFQEGWRSLLYGDIYSFYTTNSFSRDNLNYESGEVKNIHYGDIHTKFAALFDITKENVPFVNSDINLSKLKEENYCLEKDLVVADASEDYADIGKTIEIINLNKEKVIAGLHTFLARPNKHEMAKGYAGYMVQTWGFRKQVMIIAQGTKVLSLSTNRLANLKLNIPSLPEQQKIAGFLSAVDEKIQLLNRKKQLLEQYKKGVMQQLFSGKLRFKDDNGKAYPKWEEKRLMDVVEPERKIRYGVVQPGEFDPNGRLLVRGQDYSQGWANVNSLFRVSDEVEKKYSKARIKFQDLVITIVGAGTGFVAQVPIEFDDANITQTTARIAIDKTKGDPYYFLGYLRSSYGRKLIYSFIKGAAQPGLNIGDVEIFKVKVPSLAEQKKIANFLTGIDVKLEALGAQISQSQTFKKGLLQQMFV